MQSCWHANLQGSCLWLAIVVHAFIHAQLDADALAVTAWALVRTITAALLHAMVLACESTRRLRLATFAHAQLDAYIWLQLLRS
jgi:hypothetical protein